MTHRQGWRFSVPTSSESHDHGDGNGIPREVRLMQIFSLSLSLSLSNSRRDDVFTAEAKVSLGGGGR